MSAGAALSAAVRAALAELPLNGVFEAAPEQARTPWALLDDGISTDWSTKDRPGRELRPLLTIHAPGDTPALAEELAATACIAVASMDAGLNGWRIASLVLLRQRTLRERDGGWRVSIEWRVRMMEEL